MKFPTRDEVVAEAVKCIDHAFAERKQAVVVCAQIGAAPASDFEVATWSTRWDPARIVTTLSALLLPWLRACYSDVPDSPLREADRIICAFAEDVRESEKDEAQSN